MTDPRLTRLWHRAGPAAAFIGLLAAGDTSAGCGGGGSGGSAATTTGTGGSSSTSMSTATSGSMTTSSASGSSSSGTMNCASGPFAGTIAPGANGGFTDAFDATPSSDGGTVYFTAVDAMGNPGVFKQGLCPSGTVSAVYTGGSFEAPFGIAIGTDDATLYVADASAAESTDITGDKGVLFSLSAAGGTAPAILVGSVRPKSVTVVQEGGADQVYFTGIDKATGMPGVFKVAGKGGAVTTIAEGAPFSDPAGLVVSSKGDVYVVDTSASDGALGNILLIAAGSTSAVEYVPGLQVGYPAGIAMLSDDSTLMVSGLNAGATSDVLIQVSTADKSVTNVTTGIGTYAEAAGLHRAHKADVFAWADTKATPSGMTGTGTVFVIK